MKLKIELFQYDRLLFGKVIEQDDELRRIKPIEYDDFSLRAISNPELSENTLYIRGVLKNQDNIIFTHCYANKEEATKVANKILNLITKVNGMREDESEVKKWA